jgi:hypothetical protein
MENIRETQYFGCSCYSSEHTLMFNYYRDDDDPSLSEIYTTIYIGSTETFWRRLWQFIKFLFGYRCRYGDFDCFCMKAQDIDRLMSLLKAWKSDIKDLTSKWDCPVVMGEGTDVKSLFDRYIGRRVRVVMSGEVRGCGYFCDGSVYRTEDYNVVIWDDRKQINYRIPYSSVVQIEPLRF